MQMSGKKQKSAGTLLDLHQGQEAVIKSFELPERFARRLMELGFLPGGRIKAGRTAPGGDPRIFEVDGSEIALRRETALQILIKAVP